TSTDFKHLLEPELFPKPNFTSFSMENQNDEENIQENELNQEINDETRGNETNENPTQATLGYFLYPTMTKRASCLVLPWGAELSYVINSESFESIDPIRGQQSRQSYRHLADFEAACDL
ncbi:hypothetical protein, partial [Photobacterium alginatilyticum]|uniref:hypothetical protein n=1 Tax=Photobacterium alginatilyticum TaxID=1775171 RepID=UPI001369F0C9